MGEGRKRAKDTSREVKGEDQKAERTAVNKITLRRKMGGDEERGKREEGWQGEEKEKEQEESKGE